VDFVFSEAFSQLTYAFISSVSVHYLTKTVSACNGVNDHTDVSRCIMSCFTDVDINTMYCIKYLLCIEMFCNDGN